MCRIFQKSEPETSYQRLRTTKKKWLLRESRVSGMITVDWLNKQGQGCSMRLAHTENGWLKRVDASTPHEYISLKNIEAHVDVLFKLLAEDGFVAQDCLLPNAAEQTTFNAYLAYEHSSMVFFQNHEDPVSLETIPKDDLFVGPTGAIFSRETVVKILAQENPRDPLTNLKVGLHDFRPIGHIAQKLKDKIDEHSSSSSSADASAQVAAASLNSP